MDFNEYTPKPNLPPKHLSHIPVEADHFINVRVTRKFKEMVKSRSETEGCTVTRTVLKALENYLFPMS
jgi:hypothetical protein